MQLMLITLRITEVSLLFLKLESVYLLSYVPDIFWSNTVYLAHDAHFSAESQNAKAACPPSSVCPRPSQRWGMCLWVFSLTSPLFSPRRCFTTEKSQRLPLSSQTVALTGRSVRPPAHSFLLFILNVVGFLSGNEPTLSFINPPIHPSS